MQQNFRQLFAYLSNQREAASGTPQQSITAAVNCRRKVHEFVQHHQLIERTDEWPQI